jgi:hypothetical protein
MTIRDYEYKIGNDHMTKGIGRICFFIRDIHDENNANITAFSRNTDI